MEYHPSHNIYKVEEQWNRLVELERRLGLKIQEYISHAENRKELYSQWKREVGVYLVLFELYRAIIASYSCPLLAHIKCSHIAHIGRI